MKLVPDTAQGPSITSYGAGWVSVNQQRFSQNLFINSSAGAAPWICPGFEDLKAEHFEMFIDMQPELIVFGSGERLRFLHPGCLQRLYARRIGVETMDTQAACRTFNFLAGEGRKVVAALLV